MNKTNFGHVIILLIKNIISIALSSKNRAIFSLVNSFRSKKPHPYSFINKIQSIRKKNYYSLRICHIFLIHSSFTCTSYLIFFPFNCLSCNVFSLIHSIELSYNFFIQNIQTLIFPIPFNILLTISHKINLIIIILK